MGCSSSTFDKNNLQSNSKRTNLTNNTSKSNKNDKKDKEREKRNKNLNQQNKKYINGEYKSSSNKKKGIILEEVKSLDNNLKNVKNNHLINENNKENDSI